MVGRRHRTRKFSTVLAATPTLHLLHAGAIQSSNMATSDPSVQLASDAPISKAVDDTLGRVALAQRLSEIVRAAPNKVSRTIGFVGRSGAGRTSTLALTKEILDRRVDVTTHILDVEDYPNVAGLLGAMLDQLTEFFTTAGVVDKAHQIRDRVARYGNVISSLAKVAGVSVDAGTLKRSPQAVRAEIADVTQDVERRLVLAIDHVDLLGGADLIALFKGTRQFATMPFVTLVFAFDRNVVAHRLATLSAGSHALLERAIMVELELPPCDPMVFARVILGHIFAAGNRADRNVESLVPLFDPTSPTSVPCLSRIATMRDAKRFANSIVALMPLVADDGDLVNAVRTLAASFFAAPIAPAWDQPATNVSL